MQAINPKILVASSYSLVAFFSLRVSFDIPISKNVICALYFQAEAINYRITKNDSFTLLKMHC